MDIVHWMSRSFSLRGTPAEPLTGVFIRTSFHKYVNSILDKTNIKWYTATHARCSISFSVFHFLYSIFPLRIVSISFSPRRISISSGLHSSTTLSPRLWFAFVFVYMFGTASRSRCRFGHRFVGNRVLQSYTLTEVRES